MIKFIFYTFFAYILIKLFRVFLDPMFASTVKQANNTNTNNSSHNNAQSASAQPKQKEQVLGEYIEYEEVKN
jgi:hypothetical protein